MRATYAVVWLEDNGPTASGRLEFRERGIALTGASVEREVTLEELRAIRVGRSPEDRLDGRSSLVLELREGGVIRVASVAQPGIVAALARRLAGSAGANGAEAGLSFEPTPGPGDSDGGDF